MSRADLPSAREIAAALGAEVGRHGSSWVVRCPAHDDRTPSLSIRQGTGGPIWHCHAGCDQLDVRDALRDRGLWPEKPDREEVDEQARRARQERARRAAADLLDDEARTRAKATSDLLRARKILVESFAPTPETTVGKYLISREILPPWPACIRQHPHLAYYADGKPIGEWPAMVCPIRDVLTDEVVGVHRTYLAEGGVKASVTHPKKVLGRLMGAAVKLTPDEDVTAGLGICEGIETGLCVIAAEWSPVWALGSAGNLAKFPILAGLDELTTFADNDDTKTGAGEKAAVECGDRWRAAGCEVTLYIPKAPGTDWADELGHR